MMRKNYLFLLILILFAISCNEIYFDRMPGTKLSQIPKEFTRKYFQYSFQIKDGLMEKDSGGFVIVKRGSIVFQDKKKETYTLCDTITFSKYNDYYFVSEKVAPNYWDCYALHKTAKGFIGMPVMLPSERNDTSLSFLRRYFPQIQYSNSASDTNKYFYTKTNEDEIIQYFNDISKSQGYSEYIRK